ncbi:MAG: hypothetical protein HC923_13405, partial [Myxococcales bacterium]|nr:hypothetical protein [Myxococcales bacterium]
MVVLTVGCERSAEQTIQSAVEATRQNPRALRPLLHPDYVDALGGPSELIADVEALGRHHPNEALSVEVLEVVAEGLSQQRMRARVRWRGRWSGQPRLTLDGESSLVLEHFDRLSLRSGLDGRGSGCPGCGRAVGASARPAAKWRHSG